MSSQQAIALGIIVQWIFKQESVLTNLFPTFDPRCEGCGGCCCLALPGGLPLGLGGGQPGQPLADCQHLTSEGLCLIEIRDGREAKPMGCKRFEVYGDDCLEARKACGHA